MVKNFVAKVVLLGDGGVGKTSLVRRFVEDKYKDVYISTIGSKTSKKQIEYQDYLDDEDVVLKLMIVDIHGQKTFSSLHASNYVGAKGALIVYDRTRKNTFEDLNRWREGLYEVVDNVPLVVLGNKNDLIEDFQNYGESTDFENFILQNHPQILDFYKKNPEFGEMPTFEMVGKKDIEGFKKRTKAPHFVTSAKTGENVEGSFRLLGEKILDNVSKKEMNR
ncbi:MAG: Rab family GTPase [Thermoplasmata archaeon]